MSDSMVLCAFLYQLYTYDEIYIEAKMQNALDGCIWYYWSRAKINFIPVYYNSHNTIS